jgi:predicted lipoprotein with Yx(FWY)xxD motif
LEENDMRFRAPGAIAVALLVTLGLAACGDDDDAAESGTTEAQVTSTTAAASTTATTAATTGAAEDATLALGDTSLGQVLVDADGMTLYLFENDTAGVSTCNEGCSDTWPALTADDPTVGEGLDDGLLGTAPRDDGSNQVTYTGHPLYHFANDTAPGDTNGQEIGDVWYVVDASGEAVES